MEARGESQMLQAANSTEVTTAERVELVLTRKQDTYEVTSAAVSKFAKVGRREP